MYYWIKFINEIMYMLYSGKFKKQLQDDIHKVIETQITMIFIVNYIVDILIHFTKFRKDGTLNLRVYLDNVFIENIDVWGFCSSYFPFLEILFNNYNKNGGKNN